MLAEYKIKITIKKQTGTSLVNGFTKTAATTRTLVPKLLLQQQHQQPLVLQFVFILFIFYKNWPLL